MLIIFQSVQPTRGVRTCDLRFRSRQLYGTPCREPRSGQHHAPSVARHGVGKSPFAHFLCSLFPASKDPAFRAARKALSGADA